MASRPRAHFRDTIVIPKTISGSLALALAGGATYNIYQPGTTTAITNTLYDAATGGSSFPSTGTLPATTALLEFWSDEPFTFDLKISGTLITTQTFALECLRSGQEEDDEIVNVKTYGALGDGTTDDTSALQAAINVTGRVYIPPGTYKITSTVTIPTDTTIIGAGKGITSIKGALSSALLQSPDTSSRYYRWAIRDLSIDNTSRATAGGIGLDMTKISQAHIENVQITNVATGVKLVNAAYYNNFVGVECGTTTTAWDIQGNENLYVGCRVNDCTTGFLLDDSSNVTLIKPAIEVFTTGINVGAATGVCANVRILAPRLENVPTSGTGVVVAAGTLVTHIDQPYFAGLTTNITDNAPERTIISGAYDATDTSTGETKLRTRGLKFNNSSGVPTAYMYETGNSVYVRNAADSDYRDLSVRDLNANQDIYLSRFLEGVEITAPSAPSANRGRIYFEDNGAGKTRLVVLFPTGAAQVIATEP